LSIRNVHIDVLTPADNSFFSPKIKTNIHSDLILPTSREAFKK